MTKATGWNAEGRPEAVIDLTIVERAASIGCTVPEIAALLGVALSTFQGRRAKDEAIADALENGRAKGRATLRRFQWNRAEAGSDSMLIWLGKQLLEQRDSSAVAVAMSGPNGGPIQSETRLSIDPIEAARTYQQFMGQDK